MMRELMFAALLAASLAASSSFAQTARTTPTSVRLTNEQWTCLQSRLPNLQRLQSDIVRVPLSGCGQGETVRGPGAGNTTAGSDSTRSSRSAPRDPSLTRAPLYLSKDQLVCIERLARDVPRGAGATTIDLTQC